MTDVTSIRVLHKAARQYRTQGIGPETIEFLTDVAARRASGGAPNAEQVRLLLRERALLRAYMSAFAGFVCDYSNDPGVVAEAKAIVSSFEDAASAASGEGETA